jgi:hypothetical protein
MAAAMKMVMKRDGGEERRHTVSGMHDLERDADGESWA